MRWSIASVLAATLVASTVQASPPVAADEAESETQGPRVDPALAEAQALFAEGLAQFNLGQYAAAIELWEHAYKLVDNPLYRAGIQNALADAHARQYEIDGEAQHLHQAQQLLEANRDALEPGDTLTRDDIQAKLDVITAELERVEALAAAREGELTEREAAAREQVAREVELDEQRVRAEQRSRRNMTRVAVTLGPLGAVGFGIMAAGLGLGIKAENDAKAQLREDPATPAAELQPLVQAGQRYNGVAWAAGIVGGVAWASVLTMLAITRSAKRKQSPGSVRTQLRGAVLLF